MVYWCLVTSLQGTQTQRDAADLSWSAFFFSSWLVGENLPCSVCWISLWFLMLLVLQFIPKGERCNAITPNSDNSTWILSLQPLYGVGFGSFLPERLLYQKRKTLQSQKFFSSQDTMTLIQTTHFSLYNYHIIMELSLFAKNILLLVIICTTAVPRGRHALHEVYEKNIYIWSSFSHSATIWLSQTCKDWERGAESTSTSVKPGFEKIKKLHSISEDDPQNKNCTCTSWAC